MATKRLTREWLSKPAKALGGKEPLSVLKTHAGTEDVLNLIRRREHGVIA
jgi:putative toxin-antitoxin system antitoxin component (TIGR02293 family)